MQSSSPIRTPAASGAPLFDAALRREPDDFRVDERIALEHDGRGEHLWLRLEKRLLNSADVVRLLERVYAVGSADIGYSGLKDRRAVTRQWFSVRTADDVGALERALGEALPAALEAAGVAVAAERDEASLTVIEHARHGRKLRRGAHADNAFEIVLRDVVAVADGTAPDGAPDGDLDEALAERVAARLARLRAEGFPSYIGPQRFGRDGRNLALARDWFRREAGAGAGGPPEGGRPDDARSGGARSARRRPGRRVSRLQRGLWLSTARAELFNRVCAARVEAGSWARLLPGEPVVLDGTRSFFMRGEPPTDDGSDEALDERLARGDVHPSGPWWGRGEPLSRGDCAELEHDALDADDILRAGLERAGLEQARRALRAVPRELAAEWPAPATLRLSFALPPGTFATVLLAELGRCSVDERTGNAG